MAKVRTPGPKVDGGPVNPYFRGKEERFEGGELTVESPVGSIFGDYVHAGPNAMDTALEEQAPPSSKYNVSRKARR
jgi:hypothetical protein